MKLHLGCGQKYLEGYINIDYPLTEHSVQQKSIADQLADLKALRYKSGTIDEVRLHHVFEHFSRADACALLASWNSWLKLGGILRIEVPDFEKTGKVALSRWSKPKEKFVALRHIFGSQEAHWAVHFQGYTPASLSALVEHYGFKTQTINKNSHLGTYNIEIIATKEKTISREDFQKITREYLDNYLVDQSEGEKIMLDTWLQEYNVQVNKTYATE